MAGSYTSDVALVDGLWDEIVEHYSTKNRHYHNLGHLEYMIRLAFVYKSEISDFNVLLFSIFYHDIVYNVKRSDNELKSAEIASDRLKRLGLTDTQIRQCHQQIMATKEHDHAEGMDTNFLVDFDLAILGENTEKYSEYTRRVRKEYAIYPDFLYKKGRKKVLRHFLEMDKIFKTKLFIESFEAQARKNIQRELEA